jgi:hypothetical protein
MNSKIVIPIVIAACTVGAAVGGFWYGHRLATNITVNDWAVEQAHDVQGHLITLRLLRANRSPEALQSLESRLDNDLAVLEPQAPGIGLEPGVRKQIDKAFLDAKNYRAEFPPASSTTGVR